MGLCSAKLTEASRAVTSCCTKNLSLGQCLPQGPWVKAQTPDVTYALLFPYYIPSLLSLGLCPKLEGSGWASIVFLCGVQEATLQMRSKELSHGSSEHSLKLVHISLHMLGHSSIQPQTIAHPHSPIPPARRRPETEVVANEKAGTTPALGSLVYQGKRDTEVNYKCRVLRTSAESNWSL